MQRLLTMIALFLILVVAAATERARAQEPPPLDPCHADPARVVNLALANPNISLAVLSVAEPHTFESGVVLDVEHVLDGGFETDSLVSDVRGSTGCVEAYGVSPVALASILFATGVDSPAGEFSTLQSWVLFSADGQPLAESDLVPDLEFDALLVELHDGTTVTVAEFMQAGRDYIEPTPTAVPAGVPAPGEIPAIDSGASAPPSGVTAPNTGTGDGRGSVAGVALLAVIVAAAVAGVGALAVARRA